MALGRRPVDRDIVMEVCRDFDLKGGVQAHPPSTALEPREIEELRAAREEAESALGPTGFEQASPADSLRRFKLFGFRG
jgi:hypothetical protein